MHGLAGYIERLRALAGAQRFVALLRIALGFALLPSGLKKVLGTPFTDPANHGPFHEFLHAFYATGFLYTFVGLSQLVTAFLLMTQRFASLGAVFLMPIITVILVLCWSTGVYPTATVVTAMFLGAVLLVVWDQAKWRGLLTPDPQGDTAPTCRLPASKIGTHHWERCGLGVYVFYLLSCAATGGVYRPRGLEWHQPAFYVLPLLMLLPVVTYFVDRRQR
jgi:uncharacterized membrane protein YphA (DoxX/SURF4 family)